MIKYFITSLLLIVFVFSTDTYAGDDKAVLTSIEAIGIADTPEAAKKDALMNAVQKAVGIYIEGETIVKNSELIYDEILSASNGFVKEFTITVPPHKRPTDGLYQVTIRALVKKGEVAKRLRRAKLISATIEGNDAWAEAFTKMKSAEDASELLEKYFDGLALSLLEPRIIGADDGGVQPDTHFDHNTEQLWCAWTIEVSFDRKRYYEKVQPRIEKILSTLATKVYDRALPVRTAYSVPKRPRTLGVTGAPIRRLAESNTKIRWLPDVDDVERKLRTRIDKLDRNAMLVVLDSTGQDSLQQSFGLYVLPNRYRSLFARAITHIGVEIRLIDSDGGLITSGIVSVNKTALSPIGDDNDRRIQHHVPFDSAWYEVPESVFIRHAEHRRISMFKIAPDFSLGNVDRLDDHSPYHYMRASSEAVTLRWEIPLNEEQAKRIHKIEVELVESGP